VSPPWSSLPFEVEDWRGKLLFASAPAALPRRGLELRALRSCCSHVMARVWFNVYLFAEVTRSRHRDGTNAGQPASCTMAASKSLISLGMQIDIMRKNHARPHPPRSRRNLQRVAGDW